MLETMALSLPQRFVRSKSVTIMLSLVFAIGVGWVDYVTGRDIVMTPFYLLPICWVSWVAGRRAGLLVAFTSTGARLVSDLMARYAYPHLAIPYWNAFMLLVFFVVVVYLLTAFHDAHLNLEDTVAKRTAALHEEIAERKRLEAANIRAERLAVVGTMASEVAHEIRNPLGSIALNLDLIQKEIGNLAANQPARPGRRPFAFDRRNADEVHRIQHVLEDYLQFARLPKPKRRPVALNEWIDEKLAFLNGEFSQAGVKLRTSFDPALKTVNADAEQLWQATLNLIRNSLDAMPEGGEMVVSTWREGGEARIRVTDTGTGMTAEQLQQVFVPFFTTKSGGTGLGLAVVQQIMIEHGGHVECEMYAWERQHIHTLPAADGENLIWSAIRTSCWWTTTSACAPLPARCWQARGIML